MSQGTRWYSVTYKKKDHRGIMTQYEKLIREESPHDCKLWIEHRGWQFIKAEEISKERACELIYVPRPEHDGSRMA